MNEKSQNLSLSFFTSAPGTLDYYLNEIAFLRKANSLHETLKMADEGLANYPENSRLLQEKAVTLLQLQRPDEAESVLREIRNPVPEIFYLLGFALQLQNRGERKNKEALRYYEKAIDNDPENAHYQSNYGAMLLQMAASDKEQGKQLQHAGMAALEKAVTMAPLDPFVNYNYGRALFELGVNTETTRHCFKRSLCDNGLYDAGYLLIVLLTQAGMYEDARTFIPFVMENAKDDPDIFPKLQAIKQKLRPCAREPESWQPSQYM